MKSDLKTFTYSLPLALFGLGLCELAFALATLGAWNTRGIILISATEIGALIVWWPISFIALFAIAATLITRPSRALARTALILSASLVGVAFTIFGVSDLWDKIVALNTEMPEMVPWLWIGGLLLLFESCKAMLFGPSFQSAVHQGA